MYGYGYARYVWLNSRLHTVVVRTYIGIHTPCSAYWPHGGQLIDTGEIFPALPSARVVTRSTYLQGFNMQFI